jgi:type IV pilus assembly protein PilC
MPKFNWEARTRTGGTQKGVIEAATVDVVEAQLKKYGFSNIVIKAESKSLGFKLPKFGGGKNIDEKDLVIFTRQFSTMIDSGLPLVMSLKFLQVSRKTKPFRKYCTRLKKVSKVALRSLMPSPSTHVLLISFL